MAKKTSQANNFLVRRDIAHTAAKENMANIKEW
jgi:hypothetical protein